MNTCSNHKKDIAGITDMKQLAEMIGDLHYETLSKFLDNLYKKIKKDADKDIDAGRPELSDQLTDAAFCINNAQFHIEKAWLISKPFMQPEK